VLGERNSGKKKRFLLREGKKKSWRKNNQLVTERSRGSLEGVSPPFSAARRERSTFGPFGKVSNLPEGKEGPLKGKSSFLSGRKALSLGGGGGGKIRKEGTPSHYTLRASQPLLFGKKEDDSF